MKSGVTYVGPSLQYVSKLNTLQIIELKKFDVLLLDYT